jgi:protein N-terminal methyltransferase
VDLEEQNPDFLTKAKLYLGAAGNRVGCYFPIGLQDFVPMAGRYDVIWCQWVLSHLRDVDFISFMMKCVDGLSENGLIVVKENIAQDENEFDEEDSSVTRTMDAFMDLFSQAKLTVVKQDYQPKWPTNMYGVAIFALRSSTSQS